MVYKEAKGKCNTSTVY